MRRSVSNSVTVLVMRYGTPPGRMFTENRAPAESRDDPSTADRSMPEPSTAGCWNGSASTSNTADGGTGITRETETG